MSLKVVICFLGLMGVAAAASVPRGQRSGPSSYGAAISSTDSIVDVVRKFLPSLVQSARAEGGTNAQQMRKITLSFIPLARTLVTLRGINGQNYDTQRDLADIDGIERTLVLLTNFFEDMELLVKELPADWSERSKPGTDEIKEIANVALEAAQAVAEQNSYGSTADLQTVAGVGSSLSSSLDFLDHVVATQGGAPVTAESSSLRQYNQ